MNFKQISVAIVLLLGLAVIFGFWASRTPVPGGVTITHLLKGEQVGEGNLYHYSEKGTGYEISVQYPGHIPLNGGVDVMQSAQTTLETDLMAQVAEFKSFSAEALTPQEIAHLEELGTHYTLSMEYKDYGSPKYVSYWYTIFQDTGGAHPNTYFKTYVFDGRTGVQVRLADLFDPSTNWLEELSLVVSNDVVRQMKERLGQDDVTGAIFAEGLAAKEENFQNFYIDNDTFVLEIPPYQVAAYAMGSFEVRIPMSELASNLKK